MKLLVLRAFKERVKLKVQDFVWFRALGLGSCGGLLQGVSESSFLGFSTQGFKD